MASSVATYPPNHALTAHIRQAIAQAGGWLPFDRFMHLALYTPGLGYYARSDAQLGRGLRRDEGSDFVTAPELSPLFGRTLAAQVAEALQRSGTAEVWEFGAGSGALAEQVLDALAAQGIKLQRYTIVDVSGSLRQRQQRRLARFGMQVQWRNALPETLHGVLLGNEVLDAMPVQLLHRVGGVWHERGVAVQTVGTENVSVPNTAMPAGAAIETAPAANETRPAHTAHADVAATANAFGFVWQNRPTALRPPVEVAGDHDYLTEIQPQAQAFIRTVAARLQQGAAFFIDYGFGEREYYHPQRHMGTLMCHRGHRADAEPLHAVGDKDITSHIDFTAVAVAAQEAGAHLLGYTSQGRFLLNCGLAEHMAAADLPARTLAHKLVLEHEMGELFKVLGFCAGLDPWPARGFAAGDRLHTL
ncbi:MAG: SAM-dependent methyltransferase [Brachymonas sp.]|nr:SAM-dependent methyltransferase [Brachymonas sp.]